MMLDRNELRKLPGFENLPDDFLPEGVTLTRQLANLKDALKTEWDVDAKLDA